MCKILLFLLLALSLLGISISWAEELPAPVIDLETVSSAVVMIKTEFIESMVVQGETYEILLRKPGTNHVQPKLFKKEGTGTLVVHGEELYLATAAHVAKDTLLDSDIIMKVVGDRPKVIPITKFISKKDRLDWILHPTADLAALRLDPSAEAITKHRLHFLSSVILESARKAPNRLQPVTIVGFPLGLGTDGNFSPISQQSKTVSGLLTLPRLDIKQSQVFFLLDNPSIGGFSGAPVLELPGAYIAKNEIQHNRDLTWVGVVHGTTGDNTGGKLAVITPAALVLELLGAEKSDSATAPD